MVIIGLDGGTWDLIGPWAEAGELPNLRRLLASSARAVLLAPFQPITAPSWTTFMTGVNQGKHGVYDFVYRRPDSYGVQVANSTDIHYPTLFERLSQAGRRVCAINVPFSYPPRPVNGLMVSGLFAPTTGPEIAYPPDLWPEIARIAPAYTVLVDYDQRVADPLAHFAAKILAGIDARTAVARHLLAKEDWDLFMVVYTATDVASHAFWQFMAQPQETPYRHVIRDVYARVDQGIGQLLELVDDQTGVLLMSDHGSGPLHRFVQLNRLLADEGWLKFTEGANAKPGLAAHLRQATKRAATWYRETMPAPVRRFIRQALGRRFTQAKGDMESFLFSSAIDWAHTSAYSLGACGNIFINLQGREPQGTVAPGAPYEQTKQAIRERLLLLRDPESHALLVERVWDRRELYHGPFADRAPDLVVQWKDYRYWGRGRYDVNTPSVFEAPLTWDFSAQPLTATHRREGIVAVRAPGIAPGETAQPLNMVDVAPLVLQCLNLPILADMDGSVPVHLYREPPTIQIADGDRLDDAKDYQYSKKDENDIAHRLEGLGYL